MFTITLFMAVFFSARVFHKMDLLLPQQSICTLNASCDFDDSWQSDLTDSGGKGFVVGVLCVCLVWVGLGCFICLFGVFQGVVLALGWVFEF